MTPGVGDVFVGRRNGRRFRVKQVNEANRLAQLEETEEPTTSCPLRWVAFDDLDGRKYIQQYALGGGCSK